MRPLILAACLSLPAVAAFAQDLSVTGLDCKTLTLSEAEFTALPRHTVAFEAPGLKGAFEGPLLVDVLAKAGAPTGKELPGARLSSAVLATAADGDQVAFGLAEADSNTRRNRIILADRVDGKPLGKDDGPYRLVVEELRSPRQVVAIRILGFGQRRGGTHRPH